MSDNNNNLLHEEYLNSLLNPSSDPTQALINNAPVDTTPAPAPLPAAEMQSIAPGLPAQQGMDAQAAQQQFDAQQNAQLAPQQPQLAPQQPNTTPQPSLTTQRTQLDQAFAGIPGYGAQQAGIAGTAEALGAQGKQEAHAYHDAAVLQQRAQQAAEQDLKTLGTEITSLTADIKANKIKPDQYLENMSAGSKISTAIGLILGGMGGGMTHQENPVMKFLNAQIDRDLHAQRENMSNKTNLLGALERQMGNRMAAEQMFMAMRKSTLADQLGVASSQYKGPLATAAAQKASGELMQGSLQHVLQTQALIAQVKGQTGGTQDDPELLVPHLVPQAEQKGIYEDIGKVKVARDLEKRMFGPEGWFNKAKKENTVMGRVGRLGFEPPSIPAMEAQVMPLVRDSEGKVNEMGLKTAHSLFPSPGDSADTINQKERGFREFIRAKEAEHSVRPRAYRIDLDKFKNTTTDRSMQYPPEYLKWAESNPTDPRAQAFLKKIGR